MHRSSAELLLGYPISVLGLEQCLEQILSWAMYPEGSRYFACLNPHSFEIAERDPDFGAALRNANMLVPDGIGIVIASRLMGGNVRFRVTGSDLLLGTLRKLQENKGGRVFFLGSTTETLERIKTRIALEYPNVRVVGTLSPSFAPKFPAHETAEMIRLVNSSGAEILWVGLTAPKQEKWIHENRMQFQVPVIGAIGAALDFFAGTVRRPGKLVQSLGLEWLGRFLGEPVRLWRRNLVSNPRFVMRVLREVIWRGERQR